jgi:hypothetical protein
VIQMIDNEFHTPIDALSSQEEAASAHDDRPGHSRCETHAGNPQSEEEARVDCGSECGGRDPAVLP